jgi:UDP-glucose:glycoprotein glucosyltransferase
MLVGGNCYEESDSPYGGVPPNGLQIVLSSTTSQTDTLVMQNLGYFQLQANPGLWTLSLAEGRATELFQIVDSNSIAIAVQSFASDMKRLLVKKRPGFEDVSLLDDPKAQSTESNQMQGKKKSKSTKGKKSRKTASYGEEASVWSSITGLFSSKPVAKTDEV